MKALILAAALAVGAGAAGCHVHRTGRGHVHAVFGPAIILEAAHRHSDHCGHFFHGGHWYHSHGHAHRGGCGHHFRGGIWIVD